MYVRDRSSFKRFGCVVYLKNAMLHLKWPVKHLIIESESKEVIVTCPNADDVPDTEAELFVHHGSSTSTFAMLARRIGFARSLAL